MTQKQTITIKGYEHIPFQQDINYPEPEMIDRSQFFYDWLSKRRSIRSISNRPVPKKVIVNLILSAASAPSGAHKQPWTFCAISDQSLKRKIRVAAEAEEKINYESRLSDRWKRDLEPLGTDMHKPFLEMAPWLVVVFKTVYEIGADGHKYKNYYVNESVGIACGLLITAIHNAGLVTLPHTPSPMNFLGDLLERPANEKAYIIFPVGFADQNTFVPNLQRKALEEISVFLE